VERTFGWFNRYRRLSKDYEHNPESSEAWIYIAMIHRMSRFDLPQKNRDDDLLQRPPKRMETWFLDGQLRLDETFAAHPQRGGLAHQGEKGSL
jgi:hypothetical protein